MNPNQAKYNREQAEQAKKRRAMFYRLHINKKLSVKDLAKRFKVSYERMRVQIRQAEAES